MPDPCPLNETALQAAIEAWQRTPSSPSTPGFENAREQFKMAFRNAVSTYLREAGFKVEDAKGFEGGKSFHYRRQLGPWLPVDVQHAAEETTRRVAHERDKGEARTFSDPSAAAAYLQSPVNRVEEEE